MKKTQEKIKSTIGFDFFNWTDNEYNEENINRVFNYLEKDFIDTPDFIRKGAQYENVLLQFFTNWFHIQFDVCLDGDSIGQMSPGKKAAVYLELLIGLTDVKCPILIDQPEDDLDNQTIYDEVIKEILKLKGRMQFVFATHNANIPVLGDSEKIVSCSFEDGSAIELQEGTIDTPIIQKSIVDIMEGGKDAFDRRKYIYNIWR